MPHSFACLEKPVVLVIKYFRIAVFRPAFSTILRDKLIRESIGKRERFEIACYILMNIGCANHSVIGQIKIVEEMIDENLFDQSGSSCPLITLVLVVNHWHSCLISFEANVPANAVTNFLRYCSNSY
jgi:hypothetical protein